MVSGELQSGETIAHEADTDDLEGTRTRMQQLLNTFVGFNDSLYSQKHAFYFRAVQQWRDIMNVCRWLPVTVPQQSLSLMCSLYL